MSHAGRDIWLYQLGCTPEEDIGQPEREEITPAWKSLCSLCLSQLLSRDDEDRREGRRERDGTREREGGRERGREGERERERGAACNPN